MKLSKSQEEALELLKTLVKDDKITVEELFILMKAIYENEPEVINVPAPNPYPWISPWTTDPYPNTEPYTDPITDPVKPYPHITWYYPYTITCTAPNTSNTVSKSTLEG